MWGVVMHAASILLLLMSVSVSVEGSIHMYNRARFLPNRNTFLIHGGSEGLRASSIPGSENSFIRFDNIKFHTRESANGTGYVLALIFETAQRDKIGGSAYGGQKAICCTPDLAKLEGCKEGELIRCPSEEDSKWPYVKGVQFDEYESEATLETVIVLITKTGMYNLYFISCERKLEGLTMTIKTLWKNSTGYLPGRMAPLMTFFFMVSCRLHMFFLGLFGFFSMPDFGERFSSFRTVLHLSLL